MKLLIPSVALVCVTLLACKKDEQPKPTSNGNYNPVVLSDLTPGQNTTYRAYTTTCGNLNGDFRFTGDLLVLEVLEVDDTLYFKEYYTEDSPSAAGGFEYMHPVIVEDDYLLIKERWGSQLFYFYGNDTVFLNPDEQVVLEQSGCQLMQAGTPFIGNDIGHLSDFSFGGVHIEDRTAVSCVPMMFGLEAYLFYNDQELTASHTIGNGGWIPTPMTINGYIKK